MKKYYLDACALLAVLNEEDGGEFVRDIIGQAKVGSVKVSMNIINLFEVYYGILRKGGKEIANDILLKIKESDINIIETISEEVLKEAGRLKASYKMSVADSMAVAEASVNNGTLLTSDHHELGAVEKSESIKIHWIR
ncbi:MAG: PIN domain-containing protein [Oscillospiraceae bacterium]|nr:PIN domain-containing protein [Oscillospiraceae bacterium]